MPEPTFQHPDFARIFRNSNASRPGHLGRPDTPPPGARPPRGIEAWPLAFTGDGGVYFDVWIVNVLLTIVTLGLFTPWNAAPHDPELLLRPHAGGRQPFPNSPPTSAAWCSASCCWRQRIALNGGGETGQHIVYFAIVTGGAVLAPFLWGSAMRLPGGHTRWRGLRLRFTAGWGEVYRASWRCSWPRCGWWRAQPSTRCLSLHGNELIAEQQAFEEMSSSWTTKAKEISRTLASNRRHRAPPGPWPASRWRRRC